jgi:hypothetical protein
MQPGATVRGGVGIDNVCLRPDVAAKSSSGCQFDVIPVVLHILDELWGYLDDDHGKNGRSHCCSDAGRHELGREEVGSAGCDLRIVRVLHGIGRAVVALPSPRLRAALPHRTSVKPRPGCGSGVASVGGKERPEADETGLPAVAHVFGRNVSPGRDAPTAPPYGSGGLISPDPVTV